jgi:hypothetical protein
MNCEIVGLGGEGAHDYCPLLWYETLQPLFDYSGNVHDGMNCEMVGLGGEGAHVPWVEHIRISGKAGRLARRRVEQTKFWLRRQCLGWDELRDCKPGR